MNKKVVLVILDGFGIGNQNCESNAIYAANTPCLDMLINKYKYAELYASEEYVGIRPNQFGNSELGHMTIGAGRTIYGIGEMAHKYIVNHEFESYLSKLEWIKDIIKNNKIIQIFCLYSSGYVHADKFNIDALIKFLEKYDVRINLHLFSDGRDSDKFVFYDDIKQLLSWIKPTTKIASISGRYYAMDRDKKFNLINLAYDAIVNKKNSITSLSVLDYIKQEYSLNHDDEFIYPTSFIDRYPIQAEDYLCFMNYRADRIRQIIHKFKPTNLYDLSFSLNWKNKIVSICNYPNIDSDYVIFEKQIIDNTLGEILDKNNFTQLRIAETEKYAHVTFFFDCENKKYLYTKKDEIFIESPKIATYDLKPEMSAELITQQVINNLSKYDFILVNYANADMVGHTGNFEKTVQAIECLDKQLSILYDSILNKFSGTLLVTADHGNADCMLKDGKIIKSHTLSKVPFIVVSNDYKLKRYSGCLQDIAPSILDIFNIDKPICMSGNSLIKHHE